MPTSSATNRLTGAAVYDSAGNLTNQHGRVGAPPEAAAALVIG
jgi:hypothetical protein